MGLLLHHQCHQMEMTWGMAWGRGGGQWGQHRRWGGARRGRVRGGAHGGGVGGGGSREWRRGESERSLCSVLRVGMGVVTKEGGEGVGHTPQSVWNVDVGDGG